MQKRRRKKSKSKIVVGKKRAGNSSKKVVSKRNSRGPSKKRAVHSRGKKASKSSKAQTKQYKANLSFELFNELRSLVIKATPDSFPGLEKKFKKIGRIKLAVVTGSFLNVSDSRVDLLLVGDGIKLKSLTKTVKDLEGDLGKEIRYVILSVAEFKYRHEMYDRFLRDILDSPYQKVIDRIKIP